jgi:protein tyrosine phosphatase (PTP) superfamily phosphohydrolase (DUF442 family)
MNQEARDKNETLETKGKNPKRRSRGKWIFATLLLVILAGIVAYLVLWAETGRFIVVQEGKLYRSAEMSAEKLADLCREHGIRTVVDFRKEGPKTEKEAGTLEKAGVRYVHLPTEQLPGPGVVEGFLSVMSEEENLPVLIHCEHGVGRTGLHAAVYRIEFQGWSNNQARWEAMLLSGFDSFQEDTPKGRFVEEYVPVNKRDISETASK